MVWSNCSCAGEIPYLICHYFSNTCIFTSCATGHSLSLTVDQETGAAITYYSIPHAPCPSWSWLGAHLATNDLALPVSPGQAGWQLWGFACVLPACGMMRLSNVPENRGHLGQSCRSGRALCVPPWCELQYPELLKMSPYNKARVKVLNALVLTIPQLSKPPTEHLL